MLGTQEVINDETLQTARYAKALSHPVRLSILKLLHSQTCCFHGDMAELLPVAKSTLSQHLKELKNAGLIQGNISGPSTKYCINKAKFEQAQQLLQKAFQ